MEASDVACILPGNQQAEQALEAASCTNNKLPNGPFSHEFQYRKPSFRNKAVVAVLTSILLAVASSVMFASQQEASIQVHCSTAADHAKCLHVTHLWQQHY